jgi:hypoxanthine phosphoribosyltransferase
MKDTPQKIFLDWDEIDRLVDILCKKIVTELPFIDSVTGLARGGLIPAVMVSHFPPLKFTLCYSSINKYTSSR